MRYISGLSLTAALFFSASIGYADDEEEAVELREETTCFSVEGIADFMKRFDKLDESRTDTIHAIFQANLDVRDDGGFPDRFYLKSGDEENNLSFDDEGNIQEFTSLVKAAPEGTEICMQDKARAGTPVDQPGAVFNLPVSIRMKNQSGTYDIAELQDGLKDGKSFYKKMVGGAVALLVPKMTHLVVAYEDEATPLEFTVFNGDEPIAAPEAEAFNGGHVIRFKDLKKAGVTTLKVSGGAHHISPAPSVKTMKKFGIGGE